MYTCTVFEGTRLVFCFKHLGELTTDLLRMKASANPFEIKSSSWNPRRTPWCWDQGSVGHAINSRTSTMLRCGLHTLIIVPLSSPSAHKLHLLRPNLSNFDSLVQSTCGFLSAPQLRQHVFMHGWVAWPCWHVGGMAFWLQPICEDHFWTGISGKQMVYLGDRNKGNKLDVFFICCTVSLDEHRV